MTLVVQNLINIENQVKSKAKDLNIIKIPKIIAVSKTFKIEHIMPAIEHGHCDFGENKVKEAVEKWSEIKNNYNHIKLHLIGKLQTNKVKYVVPLFDYIHSLDNIKLAEKIASEQKKKNRNLKIFIQVNLENEIQKNGLNANNLKSFYLKCTKELNLNIIGLMCIPPQHGLVKNYFRQMLELNKIIYLNELSMGMSEDYLEAVSSGATYLRIGSKIFGNRF